MGKAFTVNVDRYDPYKTFRFKLYFGNTEVAGVSKISGGLKRMTDSIEYRQGGDALIRKGIGRTKYDALTFERGLTHDADFEEWANAVQKLESGFPTTSLKNLRKDLRIELLNEAGQPAHRYFVYRCWVSEYQALPELDAGANGVAIEHIKIEHEGWEHDLSLAEPQQI